MKRVGLSIVVALVACKPAVPADSGGETTATTPTEPTGPTGPTTTVTTNPTDAEVSQMSYRLHEIESMVYVSWQQKGTVTAHVEYSFDPDIWHSTPSFIAKDGLVEQLVVGVPFEQNATWRVVIEGGSTSAEAEFTTGEMPGSLPSPSVEISDESQWLDTGKYLLTSINEKSGGWVSGTYWTFIIDRKGRVVWATKAPSGNWTLYAQVALSGDHLLWDEATYWSQWDDGENSTVHRTYLDEEIEEIATPGLHHAFVQLSEDRLAWGSQAHGGGRLRGRRAERRGDAHARCVARRRLARRLGRRRRRHEPRPSGRRQRQRRRRPRRRSTGCCAPPRSSRSAAPCTPARRTPAPRRTHGWARGVVRCR